MVFAFEFRVFAFATAVLAVAALVSVALAAPPAEAQGSTLPATPPTSFSPAGTIAPITAGATSADHPGNRRHRAQVSCAGGEITVRADNSSLNGILRSIAACTGMRVTGGVEDQRVFGNYGPGSPSTILATLLDGTGSNMLLQETAANAPAMLILTPRTGVATPPSPTAVVDDDPDDVTSGYPAQPSANQPRQAGSMQPNTMQPGIGQPGMMQPGMTQPGTLYGNGSAQGPSGQAGYPAPANPNQMPVPIASPGSAVTGPSPIPQPINNVNGSPSNTSPTASTYPTTNSVPLDSLPTPSTTPAASGIVDAPNPPAPGSDTEKLLRGVNSNNPGTTNISPDATSGATLPGGTNTTTPVPNGTGQQPPTNQPGTDGTSGPLTPEQVYQQLQRMRQSQQQQAQPQTPTAPAPQ